MNNKGLQKPLIFRKKILSLTTTCPQGCPDRKKLSGKKTPKKLHYLAGLIPGLLAGRCPERITVYTKDLNLFCLLKLEHIQLLFQLYFKKPFLTFFTRLARLNSIDLRSVFAQKDKTGSRPLLSLLLID